jgi:hypothetical protein
MNKQEFIDYIAKLPNEIDFTPMTVHVKAESPNPDGTYRTITKNIKFECTYTEFVHKLPPHFLPPKNFSSISLFDTHVRNLNKSLHDLIKPSYGSYPQNWGAIPICVLAWNLLTCLRDRDESFFHTLTQDTHDILLSLGALLAFLDDPSKEPISIVGAPFSFKIGDLL